MNSMPVVLWGCVAALTFITGCAASSDTCCERDKGTAFIALFPKEGVPAGWRVGAWIDVAKPGPTGTVWLVKGGVLQPECPSVSWLMSEM